MSVECSQHFAGAMCLTRQTFCHFLQIRAQLAAVGAPILGDSLYTSDLVSKLLRFT